MFSQGGELGFKSPFSQLLKVKKIYVYIYIYIYINAVACNWVFTPRWGKKNRSIDVL